MHFNQGRIQPAAGEGAQFVRKYLAAKQPADNSLSGVGGGGGGVKVKLTCSYTFFPHAPQAPLDPPLISTVRMQVARKGKL